MFCLSTWSSHFCQVNSREVSNVSYKPSGMQIGTLEISVYNIVVWLRKDKTNNEDQSSAFNNKAWFNPIMILWCCEYIIENYSILENNL